MPIVNVPPGTQTWAAPDGSVRVWPGDDPGPGGAAEADGAADGAEANGTAGRLAIAEEPAGGGPDEDATDPPPAHPAANSIAIAAAPPSRILEDR
ncbi:MAG TPA: hypothetical protein VIL81_06520 [Candidatus Limnocylindrales bacterium]